MLSLATMTFGKFAVERRRAESADRDKATAQNLMVQALLSLTEMRDAETGSHSRHAGMRGLLAEQLSTHPPEFSGYLTPERIDLLSSLAPLHDIGKVGIPDHILNKPGALTPAELAEMRKHPVLGLEVILKAEKQAGARRRCDHGDGEGHRLHAPRALGWKWLSAGAARRDDPDRGARHGARRRLRRRPAPRTLYRPSRSHADTVEFIRSGRGTHFDPAVVDAFERVAAQFEQVAAESDHGSAFARATADQPPHTRAKIPAPRDVPSAPLAARTAAEQP